MGKGTNIGPPGAHKQWWFNSKLQCWFICLIYYRSLVQSSSDRMLWFQFDFFCQVHPTRHRWEIRLHNSFDSISIFISVLESSYKKPLKDQTPQKNFRAKSRSVSESDSKSLHDLTKSPKSDSGTRKADRRARYWKFLFDNLQRAVDAIYDTCETDESVVECKV